MRRFIYERSATNIRDWSLAYAFICEMCVETSVIIDCHNIYYFITLSSMLTALTLSCYLGRNAGRTESQLLPWKNCCPYRLQAVTLWKMLTIQALGYYLGKMLTVHALKAFTMVRMLAVQNISCYLVPWEESVI